MSNTLICPECGQELTLNNRTAGQRFPCSGCRATVEVPALARTIKRGRRIATPRERPLQRGRETSWRIWASFGGGLLAVLLVAIVIKWTYESRTRQAQVQAVEGLAAEARAAARARDYGPALNSIQAALAEASRIEPRNEALIVKVQDLHDQIAANEVKAEFPKIELLAPEAKVGAYRALRARIREDPKLARYEEAANARLDLAFAQWGEADVKQAAGLLAGNLAARAMDLCERAVGNTSTLSSERRHNIRVEADALANQIIPQRGLTLEKLRGQYTLGSEASYSTVLQRDLAELLRQRGYVVRPDSSVWNALWAEQIPFRVTVAVKESYMGLHPQTKCRISYTEAAVVLEETRRGQKRKIWNGTFGARTPTQGHKLNEFRKEFHNPAVERLFYDDARALFAKGIMPKLLTIPDCQSLPGFGS